MPRPLSGRNRWSRRLIVRALVAGLALLSPGIARSQFCDWSWREPSSGVNDVEAIEWGGDRFLAVGEAGSVWTSVDGESWTGGSIGSADRLMAVAKGDRWVAVGEGGVVATSEDGSSWDRLVLPEKEDLLAVAWSGRELVASSETGNAYWSPDARSWTRTRVDAASGYSVSDVVWTGTSFLAAAGRRVASSSDGRSWMELGGPSGTYGPLDSLASNGSRIVVTAGGEIYSSPDGKSWTKETDYYDGVLRRVRWTGREFVVVGDGGAMYTSRTGSDWRAVRSATTANLKALESDGGIVVAGGEHLALTRSEDGLYWKRLSGTISVSAKAVIRDGTDWLLVGSGGTILRGSPSSGFVDGDSPTALGLGAVVRGGDRFVAVGDSGMALASLDGKSWSAGETGTTQALKGVAFGDGLFVAVGAKGTIVAGTDGLSWSPRSSGTTSDLGAVAWGGGTFVAVGSKTILTSVNGNDWTPAIGVDLSAFVGAAVIWEGGRFVIASGGEVYTSSNGIGWTRSALPSGFLVAGIAWNGVRFVIVGLHGAVATSEDGVAWVDGSIGVDASFGGVAAAPSGELLAVGDGTASSSDGLSWGFETFPTLSSIYKIAVGGGEALALGAYGTILASSDGGRSWERRRSGIDTYLKGAVFTNRGWVAVGYAPLTSPDGRSWTRHSTGAISTVRTQRAVTWATDRFVSVGEFGQILVGPDGFSWAERTSGTTRALHGITRGAGRLVVVGQTGTLLTSDDDGEIWTARALPSGRSLFGVSYSGQFVAVGAAGTILASPDGIVWTARSSPTTADLYAVKGAASGWLAVGAHGTVLRSTNGTSWTAVASPTALSLLAVAEGGGRWVAVGQAGVAISSSNGVDWQVEQVSDENVFAVEWTGERFLAHFGMRSLFSSTDGLSWTYSADSSTSRPYGIASNDRTTVLVGGEIVWRTGSGSFRPRDNREGGYLQDVATNGTLFVSVGYEGDIRTSPTGEVWTRQSSPATKTLSGVVWNGERFVVVGGDFLSSTDGVSWDLHLTVSLDVEARAVAWNGSLLVAVGRKGYVYLSRNGRDWDPPLRATDRDLLAVTWSGREWIAVGSGGIRLASLDAEHWVENVRPLTSHDLRTVAWVGGAPLAGGIGRAIIGGTCTSNETLASDFTWSPERPSVGDRVQFSDLSRGDPTGWAWTYYWGVTLSTERNPVFTFHDDGSLYMELGVSDGRFRTKTTKEIEISKATRTLSLPSAALDVAVGRKGGFVVSVDRPSPIPIEVGLKSSDSTRVAVWTTTVRIPAGATEAVGEVAALVVGGPVTISAKLVSPFEGNEATATVQVHDELFVAAAVHAAGAFGSLWRTALSITNPSSDPMEGELRFFSAQGEVAAPFQLDGGQSRTWDDLLVDSFGLDPTASVVGTLRIVGSRQIVATARTYDSSSAGTSGQEMPAIRWSETLPESKTGYLPLLRRSERFRSNLGLLNLAETPCDAVVKLFRADGSSLGMKTYTLGPRETRAVNDLLGEWADGGELVGWASIRETTTVGQLFAYASIIDNLTNDPTTIPMVTSRDVMARFVPVVARAAGSAGSRWRTSLALVNPASSSRSFDLVLRTGASPVRKTISIGAGKTFFSEDLLGELFGVTDETPVRGPLEIDSVWTSLVGAVRIYDETPNGGTRGQSMPILDGDRLDWPDGRKWVVGGLRGGPEFRSNIGLFGSRSGSCDLRVALHDAAGGVLMETTRRIDGVEVESIDDVLASFPSSEGAFVTVEPLCSEFEGWLYGSVIDNRTNDPTTIRPAEIGR
jgi:PKD repeat protein/photosystem II stability/assembly factor-like uncharacterized protein